MQQGQQLVEEFAIGGGVKGDKTQLGGHHRVISCLVRVGVAFEGRFQGWHFADQGVDGVGQLDKIPVGNTRLMAIAVTAATGVGRVRGPVGVVIFKPAVGTVVNRQAEDRHVVRIHHPVHKADAHPVDNHERGAPANFGKPLSVDQG